eukprot:gene21242-biopygen8629
MAPLPGGGYIPHTTSPHLTIPATSRGASRGASAARPGGAARRPLLDERAERARRVLYPHPTNPAASRGASRARPEARPVARPAARPVARPGVHHSTSERSERGECFT